MDCDLFYTLQLVFHYRETLLNANDISMVREIYGKNNCIYTVYTMFILSFATYYYYSFKW